MTQAPIHRTMTAADWVPLIVLSIVWGGSFLFIGVAARELPPLTILALRVATAAFAYIIFFRLLARAGPRMSAS